MTSEARDIVERLREAADDYAPQYVYKILDEATEEIRRLREALRGLMDAYVCASPDVGDDLDKARQALSPTGD